MQTQFKTFEYDEAMLIQYRIVNKHFKSCERIFISAMKQYGSDKDLDLFFISLCFFCECQLNIYSSHRSLNRDDGSYHINLFWESDVIPRV